MFQRCQSETAEMLKFSVFPWLYLWGKGWVGSSYVCRENKWHFVLSFTACEISLAQTENRMLSWEQETQSDNHLKTLINQPRVCPFSVTVFKLCFPLLKRLLSLLIASPWKLLSCGCAKQWLGTRISFVYLCWIQPRLHWGMGEKVAFCHCDLPEEEAQSSSSAQGSRAGALSHV